MTKANPSKIIAYCHIGKVGGKRLQFYLRSHFGIAYRVVGQTIGTSYLREEFEGDLKCNPLLKYIGGHNVRPHVDFGPKGEGLQWFSIFRNPLSRVVSHYYQQTVQRNYQANSVLDWLVKHPNRGYWQINMIAGEKNRVKAEDIIRNQFSFVGLNEHYEESLLMLMHRFGLKNFRFVDGRSLPKPEQPDRLKTILEQFETDLDDIREIMHEEIKFYDFVAQIYDNQCESYGREKLSRDLESYFKLTAEPSRYGFNNLAAKGLDILFWRPRTRLLSWKSRTD